MTKCFSPTFVAVLLVSFAALEKSASVVFPSSVPLLEGLLLVKVELRTDFVGDPVGEFEVFYIVLYLL